MDTSSSSRRAARDALGWRYYGQQRPPFADTPGPGQESVWDYPRPPRIEHDRREVVVRVGHVEVARTRHACRVLETASPPTFYIPRADIDLDCLRPAPGASSCEWKGTARYWTVSIGSVTLDAVGWSYDDPRPAFEMIRGHLSFYPGRLECVLALAEKCGNLNRTRRPAGRAAVV